MSQQALDTDYGTQQVVVADNISRGQARVLRYIQEFGSITPIDAIREFGNTRLADTVFHLKRKGYNISTEMESSRNRFGESVRYARYRLVENEAQD